MRQIVRRATAPPVVLIVMFAAGYGLYGRWGVVAEQPPTMTRLLFYDLTSLRFFAYVVLTVWLVSLVSRSGGHRRVTRLVRYGSRLRALLGGSADGLIWVLVGAPLVIAAFVAAGIGSPTSASESAGNGGAHRWVLLLITVTAGMALLSAIHLFVSSVEMISARRGGPMVVGAMIWFWSAASAAGLLPAQCSLGVVIDPIMMVERPVSSGVAWVVVLLVCSLGICGVWIRDRRISAAQVLGWSFSRGAFLLALCVVVVAVIAEPATGGITTRITRALSGAGTISATITGITLMIGYAFVFQRWLDLQYRGTLLLALVRHGSRGRWLRHVLCEQGPRVVTFLVATLAVAGLSAFLAGSSADTVPWSVVLLIAYHYVVNGTLQLYVYVVVLVLIRQLVPGVPSAGIASIGMLTALALALSGRSPVAPVQLSGLWLTQHGWHAIATATAVLSLAVAGLVLAVLVTFRLRREVQ